MATSSQNEKLAYLSAPVSSRRVCNLYNSEDETYRAATALKPSATQIDDDVRSFKPMAKHRVTAKVEEFPTVTSADLKFSLAKSYTSDPPARLWSAISSFFYNCELVDFELNSDAKVLYGNYYQALRDCSFLISVATLEGSSKSVLDVRRLAGDAFTLHELLQEMKNVLLETVYLEDEEDDDEEESSSEDEEEEEDDEDTSSITEEECGGFSFPEIEEIGGSGLPDMEDYILRFENDIALLNMMIKNYEDVHLEEKNYYMSLLAHTSQLEDNRKLMLGNNYLEKVKQLICNQLEAGKDCCNATLIRNTCVFLKNLVEDMEIGDKILTALVKAMGKWCPRKENNGKHIGYLQSSRQVMMEIDQILEKIFKKNPMDQEVIMKILKEEVEEETERTHAHARESSLDTLRRCFSTNI